MYIDYKVSLWRRIKIPKNILEDDDAMKHIKYLIETSLNPDSIINYIEDYSILDDTRLEETEEFLHPFDNGNQETIILIDKKLNTITSNERS